jgi:hypothetical protein
LAAIARWKREVDDSPVNASEDPEERRIRRRSANLGLIGNELSFVEIGTSDEVVVTLPAHLVGAALNAVWGDY